MRLHNTSRTKQINTLLITDPDTGWDWERKGKLLTTTWTLIGRSLKTSIANIILTPIYYNPHPTQYYRLR